MFGGPAVAPARRGLWCCRPRTHTSVNRDNSGVRAVLDKYDDAWDMGW